MVSGEHVSKLSPLRLVWVHALAVQQVTVATVGVCFTVVCVGGTESHHVKDTGRLYVYTTLKGCVQSQHLDS